MGGKINFIRLVRRKLAINNRHSCKKNFIYDFPTDPPILILQLPEDLEARNIPTLQQTASPMNVRAYDRII